MEHAKQVWLLLTPEQQFHIAVTFSSEGILQQGLMQVVSQNRSHTARSSGFVAKLKRILF